MSKKKFDAIQNPAEAYISQSLEDRQAPAKAFMTDHDKGQEAKPSPGATDAPAGYKLDPRYIETKSRRVQLLMQPSLYEAIKNQADQAGESVNNYIHILLEEAVGGK